jgi:CheY-like chemotaxis protein
VDSSNRAPWRVLVVDDDAELLRIYRQILSPAPPASAGIAALLEGRPAAPAVPELDVTLTSRGEEAERLAKEASAEGRPFAVAFVDMRMPSWDGLRTAQALRMVDPGIYLVIATAYSDQDPERLNQLLQRDLVLLRKPFANDEVLQLARTLTRGWEIQRHRDRLLLQLEDAVVARTTALAVRLERERALAEIAARVVDLRDDESPADALHWALARIGGIFDLDRAELLQLAPETAEIVCAWRWSALGLAEASIWQPAMLDLSELAALVDRSRRGIAFFADMSADTDGGAARMTARVRDASALRPEGAQPPEEACVLGVPAVLGGAWRGLLLLERAQGFGAEKQDLALLATIAHILMRAVEQQRLLSAMRCAVERLDIAQRHARMGHYEYDPQVQQVIWSRSIVNLLGLPGTDPIPLDEVLARTHDDDRAVIRQAIARVLETGEPCVAACRMRDADGEWLRLECHGNLVVGDDGRSRILGVIRDIGQAE